MHIAVCTVSLRQLADLWSTVTALPPEVSASHARFKRHTRGAKHRYVFRDPQALVRTHLAVQPGEMQLSSPPIRDYAVVC